MKIFHIITLSTLGGAQSVVVNLANNQVVNNEIYILSGGDGEAWISIDPRVKIIKIPELKRNINWLDLIVFFKLLFFRLKHKPDIVHLHSSKIGVLGRLTFSSSKVIYTVHGFDSIRLKYRKFLPLERVLQNRCKYIVSVSQYDYKNLHNAGVSHNVKWIYNGISNFTAHSYGILLNIDKMKYSRIILCIARMTPPKRADLFLSVAKLLPQYAFVWIGNYDEVKNSLHNTFFLGNIPDAYRYNTVADLFFLPSDYEGLPMTIIEAMSFGKPVVASNVGGISEIVIDNENGFVVDNCADLFADKIRYILDNDDVYQCFSEKSFQKYDLSLKVQTMCDKYMNLYKS